MKFLVTGATGFIGQSVIQQASARGHDLVVLARDCAAAKEKLPPFVAVLSYDQAPAYVKNEEVHSLIHLAWGDVGKYTDPMNFIANVEPQFRFLKSLVDAGISSLTIAGTCLEYGLREGRLPEEVPTLPVTYYGLAKSTLCRMLQILQRDRELKLNWLRYFYVYGIGQRQNALLPQLLAALARGDLTFKMSPGDQLRDFVHVDDVAANTVTAAECDEDLGILNIGCGKGIKVADFVREILRIKGAKIDLETGAYGYPPYEPFSFHADVEKLLSIPGMKVSHEIKL